MIDKAVIPAAGLGTRMLPLTKSIPKEMLPVGRKPMIQHAVEELASSGIKKICIVISSQKEVIKEHFLSPYTCKQDEGVEEVERLVSELKLSFIYQRQPLGLGDALMTAREFVGNNAFVMAIPDQILYSRKPATLQLLEHSKFDQSAVWTSLIKPPSQEAPYFGADRGLRLGKLHGRVWRITEITPHTSQIRGFGRTILQSGIFRFLEQCPDYVDGLGEYIKEVAYYGVLLEGIPFDFGTLEGYYRWLPKIWSLTQQNKSA